MNTIEKNTDIKQNNFYKILSLIFGVALLVSLAYIFKLSNQVEVVETELASETVEKDNVLNRLEELKANYDLALSEKSEISEELEAERQKVNQLISEIKKKNIDASSLAKYENQIKSLENKMRTLILENDALKKANSQLVMNIDSLDVALSENTQKSAVLAQENMELNAKIAKASRLVITNLNAQTLKVKSSGKEVETDKASRVNAIKIEFTIPENKLANSGEKIYFIQVIDPKNNIIGEKREINFEDKLLVYSFPTKVNYTNKTIQVSEIIRGDDFVKGKYYVNIFDNDTQVSSNVFELK